MYINGTEIAPGFPNHMTVLIFFIKTHLDVVCEQISISFKYYWFWVKRKNIQLKYGHIHGLLDIYKQSEAVLSLENMDVISFCKAVHYVYVCAEHPSSFCPMHMAQILSQTKDWRENPINKKPNLLSNYSSQIKFWLMWLQSKKKIRVM